MEGQVEPKLRLEASSKGQVEPKWRLEVTLESQVEPEWRLEATLEGQVDLGERLERRPGALKGRLEALVESDLAELSLCSLSGRWSCGTSWQNIM